MYGLKYDEKHYDAKNNKYYNVIPWKYLEASWPGEDTELMVIKNTRIFIEKFEKAAEKLNLSYAHGKVHYDLDEKLSDIEYYDLAMKDGFESVFHKVKEEMCIRDRCNTYCIKCYESTGKRWMKQTTEVHQ